MPLIMVADSYMHFFSGLFVEDWCENAYEMTPELAASGGVDEGGSRSVLLRAIYRAFGILRILIGNCLLPDSALKEILDVLRQKASSCR